MKATLRRKYSQPDGISIEEVDSPLPKSNEVLIEVCATTVNRTDCANLTGKPFIMHFVLGLFKPKLATLGTDFSGKIVDVGQDVTGFKKGDEVFGFVDTGISSSAEYCVANEKQVHRIPKNIDVKKAVACLEGAHYAYSVIDKTDIKSGQRVFINGATGAIGNALLQFVRQFDVHIAATSSPNNVELIRALGADEVIDFTKEDFTKRKDHFDFIFDAVGKSTFGKCKPLLTKKGIYISSELGPYSQNIFYSIFTPMFGGKKVYFPIPKKTTLTIPYIIEQVEKDVFFPIIDREYELMRSAEAYSFVMSGQKTGNVLLNIANKKNATSV